MTMNQIWPTKNKKRETNFNNVQERNKSVLCYRHALRSPCTHPFRKKEKTKSPSIRQETISINQKQTNKNKNIELQTENTFVNALCLNSLENPTPNTWTLVCKGIFVIVFVFVFLRVHTQYDTARRVGNVDLLVLGARLTPELIPVILLSIPSNVSSSVFIVSSSSCISVAGCAIVVVVLIELMNEIELEDVLIPYVKLCVRLILFAFLPKFRISRAQVARCRSSCIAT